MFNAVLGYLIMAVYASLVKSCHETNWRNMTRDLFYD